MVKQYRKLTDQERRSLIDLIHKEGYSIKKASLILGIPYANAKVVNKTFLLENRTSKKHFRFRLKDSDIENNVIAKQLIIQRENPFENNPPEIRRRTCGIKSLFKRCS